MSFLYNFLIKIFYIPFLLLIFIRKLLRKEHNIKFKEKFLPLKKERPEGYLFWFHAASLGELNSILTFIDYFAEKDKKYNFLITTLTLSSFYQIKKKYGANPRIFHQFLPYDSKFLVNNFFENWKPNIVSFVDSEIWPNFIYRIQKEEIPFILLNARITKKTFNKWKLFRKSAYKLFGAFSICISSNKETVDYLKNLKAKSIKYFGNIKFCSLIIRDEILLKNQLDTIIKKKIWCALSIHPGEEIFCGNVHKIIMQKIKDAKVVIIPRHTNKIKKIYSNLIKMGFKVQIKNEHDKIDHSVDVILINYYGSTSKYIGPISNIFIGKSMIKKLKDVGGQNPIDAAKSGCKIFHGPYVYNFSEIYDYLNKEKIAEEISDEPNFFAKKLIKNFEADDEIKLKKNKDLEIYSNNIFKNVISEYEKYLK